MSPSVFPSSVDDFKSAFSSGATFPGTPIVAIIDAATKYTLSFSPKPFSFWYISLFKRTKLASISRSRFSFSLSISS